MSWSVLASAAAFVGGLAVLVLGIVGLPERRSGDRNPGETLRDLLPSVKEGEEQNLRLAGITPEIYALQRIVGLVIGLIVAALILVTTSRGPTSTVLLVVVGAAGGWFLPMMGVRDTAKRARLELDQIIRLWIALVAQQIQAGVEPSVAMLAASQAGQRNSWRLLHRSLLAAQNDRRPTWEGLVDLVDRYGIHTLAPVTAALGLAAERGTRISEAVLVAADTLWRETVSREREKAGRRAQIIVLPATGVALALAAILIYPPFTSLTGGGVAPNVP